MKLLRVLYIASELAPFTGDSALAKENQFLSRAIAELGVDLMIALPGYRVAETARAGLARRLSPVRLATSDEDDTLQEVTLYEGTSTTGRVTTVVIDLPSSQDSPAHAADPAAFCRAALEIARARDAWPDLVVATPGTEPALGLARRVADELPAPATLYTLRELDDTAEMRDALTLADRVVAPSASWVKSLRKHIEDNPRSRDREVKLLAPVKDRLRGVTGGIDTIAWNPGQDRHLIADFSRDPKAGKAHHKDALKRELGLRGSGENTPLMAVLGPLDPNIITYGVANALGQCPVYLVVLADAERDAASLRHIQRLVHQAPSRVAVRTLQDPAEASALEHRVLAAADLALFAHDFDPARLCELHCMRYGAVPVAPARGSFADTLVEFDVLTATGTGFLFQPGDSEQLIGAVQRALRAHERAESFAQLVDRVMATDLSWKATGQRYVNIMLDLLRELDRLAA